MLDLKEERAFAELRRLGQELHLPIPEILITLEVFDKDGKLIKKHHQRSHSWTRNYYNYLMVITCAKNADDLTWETGKLSIKDTTGAIQEGNGGIAYLTAGNLDAPQPSDGILTQATDIDKGIVVGSGENADSFEDYQLQTPITEGVGGGQLNAVASDNHDISEAGLILIDTQVRYFNNNSGGNVLVNEVAWVNGIYCGAGGRYDTMMSRDKLGSTVTIPDTGQLKVTYTIQLTYPS